MPNRTLFSILTSELREIKQALPFFVVAFVLAAALGPAVDSLSSGRVVLAATSPISPISPIVTPTALQPPKFLPRSATVPPSTPAAGQGQTSPVITKTPERLTPPTTLPTIEIQAPVQLPTAPPPPPPSPVVAQPPATPPPTLWIVVGLLVVGAIVGALIFFRKE